MNVGDPSQRGLLILLCSPLSRHPVFTTSSMVETMLLLWGRNDDGQLGNRRHSLSLSESPHHKHTRRPSDLSSESAGAPIPSPKQAPSQTRQDSSSSMTKSTSFGRGLGATEVFSSVPIPCVILADSRVLQVSCGSRHTLAVVEGGSAFSWGWGASGQLGHGDDHSSGVPRLIEGLQAGEGREGGGPVTCVSAGGIHSAAVVESGSVYTWGGSSYGQLGLGPEVTARAMQEWPERVMLGDVVPPKGSNNGHLAPRAPFGQAGKGRMVEFVPRFPLLAKTVACGGMHTAALTNEGAVYCWGRADSGQLGIGAGWIQETSSGVMGVEWPKRVGGHLEKRCTASIACGGFHTAAVTTEGECYTWGKEDYGMLGCSNEALLQGGLFNPHPVAVCYPSQDPSEGEREKVLAVACGGWHTAVIGERGGVWLCGRGEYGRLGLGDQTSQSLFTPVPLGVRESDDQKNSKTCDGEWNKNGFHPVDDDADADDDEQVTSEVTSPLGVSEASTPPPRGLRARRVSRDVLAELAAVGAATAARTRIAAVRTRDPVTEVTLGGSHSLVLTASGKVFAFGRQENGRLGMGDEELVDSDVRRARPVEVTTLQRPGWKVQSISCGGVHSAAILVRESGDDDGSRKEDGDTTKMTLDS